MASGWVLAEMVLCTDDVIESRYGRLQIPAAVLKKAAADMNTRPSDLTAHHDPSQRIALRNSHAFIEVDEEGRTLLKMRAEVEADSFAAWQAEVEARGAPGGMSTTFTQPYIVPEGIAPVAHLAADAADFSDEELSGFAADAYPNLPLQVERMFQFAADIEPVRVAVVISGQILMAVPPNIIANWLAGVLRRLRSRATELGRRPAFDVQVEAGPDGVFSLDARFWADSDEMALQALEQVMDAVKSLSQRASDDDSSPQYPSAATDSDPTFEED